MKENTFLIIDFDSTFTQVEALDELANIVLKSHPDKDKISEQIKEITDQAMAGKIPFDKSLEKRLALMQFNQTHLNSLIEFLKTKISISFLRNKNFIQENAQSIYIVSGGFQEFIIPVVADFGIKANHVFANQFIFDEQMNITGFDKSNLLSKPKGKVNLLSSLNFQGKIIAIGDGFTDYELKEHRVANFFYLFTENITRQNLISKSDGVISCFEDLMNKL